MSLTIKKVLSQNKPLPFIELLHCILNHFGSLFLFLTLDQFAFDIDRRGEIATGYKQRFQRRIVSQSGMSALSIGAFVAIFLTSHPPIFFRPLDTSPSAPCGPLFRSDRTHIRTIHFFRDFDLLSLYDKVIPLLFFGFHEKLLRRTAVRAKEHRKKPFFEPFRSQ